MTIVCPQPIVDVENVIIILVVIPIIVLRLARFGQHTPGVVRRLVSEGRIADAVGLKYVCGDLSDRL